jgi:chromosome segregation ATPase
MVFSLGNVITLLIVVLVLALYRQMDRNNRSLDKIKRYSDKIKGELDGFVDGKTQQVKNLAIDLDVHQKTGKEILKRIVAIEEELGKKAGNIELVHQKIGEYDKTLGELSRMTGQVEENLKRLHQESDFVDKVGKRVKEAGVRILQLEKEIPDISNRFAKENSAALQKVSAEVLNRTRKIVTGIHQEVEEAEERIRSFSGHLDGLEQRREEMEGETLKAIELSLEEQTYRAEQQAEELLGRYRGELEKNFEEHRTGSETYQRQLENGQKKLQNGLDDLQEKLDGSMEQFRERVAGVERVYSESLDKAAQRGLALEDETFDVLKKEIERKRLETEKQLLASIQETGLQVHEFEAEIRERYGVLRKEYTSAEDALRDRMDQTSASLDQLNQKAGLLETDLKRRQEEKLEGFERTIEKTFSDLEDKISSWEEEISYRFTRIEEVSSDIDSLESNLRDSMDRVSSRVRDDFANFKEEMASWRGEEKKRSDADIGEIRGAIEGVEGRLNELKTQAYQNVSEKLEVFESEFFGDLQRRTGQMDERMESWKKDVEMKLEELASTGSNSRQKIEAEYADELKQRLNTFQGRIYAQQEKFEQQVAAYQERISDRMDTTGNALTGLEESLKNQIVEVRESSGVAFQKEFTEYDTSVSSQIKRQEREVNARLTEITEGVDAKRQELSQMMDSARTDLLAWQEKVLQELEGTRSDLKANYAELKKSADENIGTISREFETQRDDLIFQTQEERTRLKSELKEISDTVLEFEGDLRKRTEAAFDNFNREYDTFMLEIQKRNRDFQADLDLRIKDFKSFGHDTREKVELLQKKLLGRVEENSTALESQLQDIDKRLKGFVAQTKMFERADSMKVGLQEAIEDLKSEISRIEVQSQEIRETERKFQSIKKLGEEVNGRLNRFLAEKRRLEEMEGDFKKLINISQAVDVKLDQVTGSHDELQAIQARLRNLEDLEKEIEQRYERLEKRREVMDSTIEGVDSNFQRMTDFENELKELESRLGKVPGIIDELSRRIETLATNKRKAEAAMEQLGKIDSILTDSEKRVEELQKAREWLARTETRLEEVSKQAQEQVKLLGTIMKDDGAPASDKRGAPGMNARELVSRLARQGWTVDQISRATKLSKGEVELILEMIPNNR